MAKPASSSAPRLVDFTDGILDLMMYNSDAENDQEDFNIELITLDFMDAFYTLWLEEAARGALAFQTLSGWAAFLRLCFGMAGAPLIWGRVAAGACRLAQATFAPSELRIQCYVDDPAIALRGSPEIRRRLAAMLLLFWSALGLKLSFSKGTRGRCVPWIGATVKVGGRQHPSGKIWLGPLSP